MTIETRNVFICADGSEISIHQRNPKMELFGFIVPNTGAIRLGSSEAAISREELKELGEYCLQEYENWTDFLDSRYDDAFTGEDQDD